MKIPPHKKMKLMIIDDDPDMLGIYGYMFSNEPEYEVKLVDDAAEGLRMLEKDPCDLLILDIIMEPLSGESLFVYIRGNKKTESIPILIVSVLDPASLSNLELLNHTVILQKPINKEILFKAIEKCRDLYCRA